MAFLILIGASGSGKTTIARMIASQCGGEVQVFHFDQIGVPSAQQMISEYGSGEAWQRAKTLEWIGKLASVVRARAAFCLRGKLAHRFSLKPRRQWETSNIPQS